ncbi:hypothetical protein K8R78_01785 [bacterium]|nr:hypothetical protein [bacterium]
MPKSIIVTIVLPLLGGIAILVILLLGIIDEELPEEGELQPPQELLLTQRNLFIQGMLAHLAEGELHAWQLGGLSARPLEAPAKRRLATRRIYASELEWLEQLTAALSSQGYDAVLESFLNTWRTHLEGALGWLDTQEDLAQQPGYIKYLERPLHSERPHNVEVDRLLARGRYEQSVMLGRMVLEQRRLAWRRAEELSRQALATVLQP